MPTFAESSVPVDNYIGHREVRMMDEAYSYGYSNIRDAATITPRSEVQPLVLPDDIMKLPSLRGFLVFPEGFDAARIKLAWKDYPKVAEGYLLRENVEPIEFSKGSDEEADDTGEAGGRETKEELQPAPVSDLAEDKARPVAAIEAEQEGEGQASPLPGETDLAAGRISAVMSFRAGGASPAPDSQSRHAEAEAKAITRTAGKAAIQRSVVAARELAEGLEPESRTERSTGGPKAADTPEMAPDDGMEM